jgi:hypothetical protein
VWQFWWFRDEELDGYVVFHRIKLGINPQAVKITPVAELLLPDSVNGNLYTVELPLSPCERNPATLLGIIVLVASASSYDFLKSSIVQPI